MGAQQINQEKIAQAQDFNKLERRGREERIIKRSQPSMQNGSTVELHSLDNWNHTRIV